MKKTLFIILCLILWAVPSHAKKEKSVREGVKSYESQDYERSLEEFEKALKEDPSSDIINFDVGAALYKNQDYRRAASHFRKSLLGDNESLKQMAYYNLGNTFYHQGIELENTNVQGAIKNLEQALMEYKKSLDITSDDADAQANYAFVQEELERLKKKQQQQQQQNQNQQNQQNQNQQNNDQPQNDQNQSQKDQSQNQDDQRQPPREKEDQSQSDDNQEQKDKPQPRGQAPREYSPKELSEEEAKQLLESYKNNEEPKELLNLQPKNNQPSVVEKDW